MSALKHLTKTLVLIILGTLVGYLLFKYVAPVVAPFIVALFLAFFIEPVVNVLQEQARFPRALAVGLSMLLVFGGAALVLSLVIARLILELFHLTAFLPDYINNIKTVLSSLHNRIEAYYFNLPQDVLDFINERIARSDYNLDSLLSRVQMVAGRMLNFILQMVASVPTWVIFIIIAGIATYFMSKDKTVLTDFWLRVIPKPWGRKSLDITREIFHAIIGYVRAQSILISITFIQSLIGLYLIGAPYALIVALAVGLADIIPILGPSAIYLPWIAWEFISGDTVFAVKLTILYAIVLVVRQVLETKIVSRTMGLHPLPTLVSMYVGLKLLGTLGVVAGPLFIITVKAFISAGLIGWNAEEEVK